MKSLETNRSINTALVYAALGAGALLMIFPFIWMVFTSFKSAGESVQIPPTILPKQWMKENYLRAIASPALYEIVCEYGAADSVSGALRGGIFLSSRVRVCKA